jgi:hypothetical protein
LLQRVAAVLHAPDGVTGHLDQHVGDGAAHLPIILHYQDVISITHSLVLTAVREGI